MYYVFRFCLSCLQKTVRTMMYLKCELTKRVLPVATFVLISFLLSGKLVCARPQDTVTASQSGSSELKSESNFYYWHSSLTSQTM